MAACSSDCRNQSAKEAGDDDDLEDDLGVPRPESSSDSLAAGQRTERVGVSFGFCSGLDWGRRYMPRRPRVGGSFHVCGVVFNSPNHMKALEALSNFPRELRRPVRLPPRSRHRHPRQQGRGLLQARLFSSLLFFFFFGGGGGGWGVIM